jgi:UDPglucose--hexose-1-phosphate uridylyltransferase
MPELRKDPITGSWVIIAVERSKRPSAYIIPEETKKEGLCPFCPGYEDQTPPEVFAIREPGTLPGQPGWQVRVVPNKFAALVREGEPYLITNHLHETRNGVGAHEVIIEDPQHIISLPQQKENQIELIFKAWRERFRELAKDEHLAYTQIFKNHGQIAGASLEHPHSQLIATPVVPKTIQEELQGANQYFQRNGECIYCTLIDKEKTINKRVVASSTEFVAFCPYASRFPFETWILPLHHQHSFGEITDHQIADLSFVIKDVIARIFNVLDNPPFNMVLHTSPYRYQKGITNYHWHLELFPRLTIVAGFEWGTGYFINPTAPEIATEFLQDNQSCIQEVKFHG